MLLEISQSLASLKAGNDLINALFGLIKGQIEREKLIELSAIINTANQTIFNLQAANSVLANEKRTFEEKLIKMEEWNSEKQKYELKRFGSGASAYIPKDEVHLPEASHQICTNCYHNGHKSVLQGIIRNPGRCNVFECHKCGSDIYISGAWYTEHASRRK